MSPKYLGNFNETICRQELVKIAQSGHTGERVRESEFEREEGRYFIISIEQLHFFNVFGFP